MSNIATHEACEAEYWRTSTMFQLIPVEKALFLVIDYILNTWAPTGTLR